MANKLDRKTTAAAREDARRLEEHADSTEPYPADTVVSWPNALSRMFNVRLSEEQYEALQELGRRYCAGDGRTERPTSSRPAESHCE